MNGTKISLATTVAIFLFIATVMLFSSCRTGRQIVVVEGKDSIRIEERVREIKVTDTLFVEVPMQKESTTDTTIYREKVIPKVVTVEKGLSDWQKMQIRGFWIFLILTSGYIIIRKKFL